MRRQIKYCEGSAPQCRETSDVAFDASSDLSLFDKSAKVALNDFILSWGRAGYLILIQNSQRNCLFKDPQLRRSLRFVVWLNS